jgi:ribonuclease D
LAGVADLDSLLNRSKEISSIYFYFVLTFILAFISSSDECKSLTSACEKYLGKPLRKAEQLSDWGQRPLSEEQLKYASLDAHSLLGILDVVIMDYTQDLATSSVCTINIAERFYLNYHSK